MKTKFKYEERTIQLFYHFGINRSFSKQSAFDYLRDIYPKITINAVRDTLERVIWGRRYLEEDTYNQWYWKHFYPNSPPPDSSNKSNSMMNIFVDRDKLYGVDKRKNYYQFSITTAYNLIYDFGLEVDNDLKKQITKGILLDK